MRRQIDYILSDVRIAETFRDRYYVKLLFHFFGIKGADSPLANVALEIEERRCDLIDRRRHLRDKVATMGHSIPAVITCNMWRMANDDQDCHDASYRIVRQILDKLSPQPDPVDVLLAKLKSTVNDLRLETAQLHVRARLIFDGKF